MYKKMHCRIEFPDKLTKNDRIYIDRYVRNNYTTTDVNSITSALYAHFKSTGRKINPVILGSHARRTITRISRKDVPAACTKHQTQ